MMLKMQKDILVRKESLGQAGVEMANYHMEGYKQEFKPAHHEKWYWALLGSGEDFTEI